MSGAGGGFRPGPRNLITDVGGLLVGNAEDRRARTGVTVLTARRPFTAAVDVMGGAPGTRETDLLAPDRLVQEVNALVLAGGSVFGLDAASGVTDALAADGFGHAVGPALAPIAPAAILFDLLNGGDKGWTTNPYRALGVAAYRAASESFALGSAGAGAGALTAGLKGGLGSASLILPSGVVVGALAAVNALGSAVAPDGRRFWAGAWEMDGEFGGLGPPRAGDVAASFRTKRDAMQGALGSGANTTICIVATDAALSQAEARRMAVAAQDGVARALVPAHTLFDGDLVFAAATGARDPAGDPGELFEIGHAAAICLARAIARGVYEAASEPGDLLPAWRDAAA